MKRTKRIVQISLCLAAIPLLLQGCSTAPEESTEEAAPVVVQGERLDAPILKEPEPTLAPADAVIEDVTGTARIASAPEKKAAGAMPLNATGQKAVDALVGTVAPPSSTATLVKKSADAAAAEIAKATADEKGYKRVPFDVLSGYEYMIPTLVVDKETEEQLKDQIPNYIMALDDNKVSLEGYMVPLDIEDEKVKSFILTNSMMLCCFGSMPWINEWVYVEMDEGHEADFFNDTVIQVSGVLDVGEEIEDGIVLSLYRMEGQDVKSQGKPLNYLFEDYKQY
ncbi:MAG: DUF3299 domain-containing protein [Candidatus Omnitrophica bacterium]|nr:DUF3299 domain-containing protein [Candidatus Omnitrophota bacterium]